MVMMFEEMTKEEKMKFIRCCNKASRMYEMLRCIHKKRLIPESWKSHYKELEELIDYVEGKDKETFDGRMPV